MIRTAKSLDRRRFLHGVGGAFVALPFLPSLQTGSALAQGAVRRRFVGYTTEHGAVQGVNMNPADSMLTQQTEIYTGHTIRSGALVGQRVGANSVVSPVISGPTTALTDRLIGKLNVLRGLDQHFPSGHHQGAHLGNYAAVVGGNTMEAWPTIDQAMAWSPNFYPDLSGIRQRSIVTGQSGSMTWGYSNPAAKSGSIQSISNDTSSRSLFTKLIGTAPTNPDVVARKPIMDRVLAGYKQLRNGNRRLSAEDRQRLDDHIGWLDELDRRITLSTVPRTTPSMACMKAAPVTEANTLLNKDPRDIDGEKYFAQINDIIAMAFACDTTRVVVAPVIAVMTPYTGSWHQDIAHQSGLTESQRLLTAGAQQTFQKIFLDLASKLDAIEETPGRSILDNTLMHWSQEAGPETHNGQAMTVVMAGSAGGSLKTGMYVDYRNRVPGMSIMNNKEYLGLGYRQWFATALQAVGVPRSEYERNGKPGYADGTVKEMPKPLPTQVTQMTGDYLPLLKA